MTFGLGPAGCQPKGSKVLTSIGTWKYVEEVKVGDKIISPQKDGSSIISTVLEIVKYTNRPVYEIKTKGRSTKKYKCADNHIIPYLTIRQHKCDKVKSYFKEIEESQVVKFLSKAKSYRKNCKIFTTTKVEFDIQYILPLHPYIVGCLLGDGGVTSHPTFTNSSDEVWNRLTNLGLEFGKYSVPAGLATTKTIVGNSAITIKSLEFYGKDSYTKFVPTPYKNSCLEQRLDLLAGLIDTDGSIDSYTSCSELLIKDFVDLVHSVGGFAHYKSRITTDQNGKKCKSYRAHYAFGEYKPNLSCKYKDQGERDFGWKNPRNRGFDAILVGKEDVYGFVLDSESQWYITDDWLVTHNTGKTFLAVAKATEALAKKTVKKIILVRPAVEAGEKLGFLPGNLQEKVDPYLTPLYDALDEILGPEKVKALIANKTIEIAPLAFMRGRTLKDAFIIMDEAQNTTYKQLKMFLTRFGNSSKVVITGDESQVDLPNGQESGLSVFLDILEGTEGIGFHEFDARDVVRHPLVAKIVIACDNHEGFNEE